ncbi:hypothetical protein P8452_25534 [Trifolium repens]|jgi:hypothetical protein|nr:hypothetical protein P8452_25534 [Trifolium repens]
MSTLPINPLSIYPIYVVASNGLSKCKLMRVLRTDLEQGLEAMEGKMEELGKILKLGIWSRALASLSNS